MTTAVLQQSEAQFEAAVVEFAKLCGWKVFHPFDSRRSEPGFPDLTLVRAGRLIFAELKSDKGRVKPEQQAWLDALDGLRLVAVKVYVWRPSLWPEIETVLA
ncbi:MAG: hypothetical protein JWM85_335 [Acidimicrobiaceae bacterium]|nr:hypothetical protein [Acidimicrobiaceae bacterium]